MELTYKKSGEVGIIEEFFKENNLWHCISQNHKSESCADAASKRNRLGSRGIPIADELKSNFGYIENKNREKRYVLLHCRGNQQVDLDKVNRLLDGEFKRLSKDHLEEKFGLEYGIVNPLISITHPQIIQVFDISVTEKFLYPFTMMTNAGHFNWGLEFRPKELISTIGNSSSRVCDITQEKTRIKFKLEKIGILTGNSPASGIMLWQAMNAAIREKLGTKFSGDISYPEVLIESSPGMGLSMELDLRENETRDLVLNGVKKLCEGGATLIAIACNTTQYFSREINNICKSHGARYVSMSEVVNLYLQENQISQVDFLGIKYVTDFSKWSDFSSLNQHIQLEIPSDSALQRINDLAFEVKKKNISSKGINELRRLIQVSTKTDVIIIALTEISILLASQKKKQKSGKTYIDTLSLLAEELASSYVKGISGIYNIPNTNRN